MKKNITNVLKYIAVFFAMIACFNLTLFLVCSFSSKGLRKNVIASHEFLQEQGYFYQISQIFDIYNNNCTETVILNEAYSVDNSHPFESYMKMRKNYDPNTTENEVPEPTGEGVTINYSVDTDEEMYNTAYDPIGELDDFLNGRIHSSIVYGRYWHGYMLLYRPLLLIANIEQIKVIQAVTFVLLLIGLIFLLYKRFGKNIAFIFGASLLCSGYLSASYSLESAPVFIVGMISSIILLIRLDKIKNFGIYIFIVGCITNFMDYLTVPLIPLGLVLSIYFLKLFDENNDWKKSVIKLISYSFIWLVGYAGTWIFKWLLYDLTINDSNNMLSIGFTQSFYRMQRDNVNTNYNFFVCLMDIFKTSALYTLISLSLLLIINKCKVVGNNLYKKIIPFGLISLYPLVWYIVLANHTLLHFYFTYRQSLLFMLGTLLCFYLVMFKVEKKRSTNEVLYARKKKNK